MTDLSALDIAIELIQRPSITPQDEGCQDYVISVLSALGFKAQQWNTQGVKNTWLTHGSGGPVFAFAGHTDVVPPGPLDQWQFDPFAPTVKKGMLYGRGAADMKGALGAMIHACHQWVTDHPNHSGTLGLLLTSDEEGDAIHGTAHALKKLKAQGEYIDYCVVGEPTAKLTIGDTIKVGRRGSMHGYIKIHGQQGHVAYPHLAQNAIHLMPELVQQLTKATWDTGTERFPPTTLQIVHLASGEASNIIPGAVDLHFNMRFAPVHTPQGLQMLVLDTLSNYPYPFDIHWKLAAKPFYTQPGHLRTQTLRAIEKVTGLTANETTDGGTSDARFLAEAGCEVIELGLCNATIHQTNECASVDDIAMLSTVYTELANAMLKNQT